MGSKSFHHESKVIVYLSAQFKYRREDRDALYPLKPDRFAYNGPEKTFHGVYPEKLQDLI